MSDRAQRPGCFLTLGSLLLSGLIFGVFFT